MTFREIFDSSQKAAIRVWAKKPNEECRKKLISLARCKYLAGPIAVMPDVHAAGDICVGTVFVTKDVLFPGMMGTDWGCGMAAEKLTVPASALNRDLLKQVFAEIRKRVPTGKQTHRQSQKLPDKLLIPLSNKQLSHQRDWLGARHLGTLGGGNHFIELAKDVRDGLWASVHVGSRGMGAALSSHHQSRTEALVGRKKFSGLPASEAAGSAFWSDLHWALDFAAENRRLILDQVRAALTSCLQIETAVKERVEAPHNFISREVHENMEFIVHRKGAMALRKGQRGLIPGSMGSASHIVEGLGNPNAYDSSSHGAGRVLSRAEARKNISIKQLRREMGDIVYPDEPKMLRALVEEAPSAYRDLGEVLDLQADLVRPVLRLEPLAVIKGY